MQLIGTCKTNGFTVEAYFPERGKEDIWSVWIVKDGRVVHEVTLRMEVASPYGFDHQVTTKLEYAATRAVAAALRKEGRPGLTARPDRPRRRLVDGTRPRRIRTTQPARHKSAAGSP
ncbi:MAG: hypothetical protein ACREPL_13605 [Rhodanobacteraceae bacterium]